jgi:hypothetical protein
MPLVWEDASDEELDVLSRAFDALAREDPQMLRDKVALQVVHGFGQELIARRTWRIVLGIE